MKLPHPFRQQQLRTRNVSVFAKNLRRAFQRYGGINGEQCAASSAYYAFFSLFPLILLLVAVSTFFFPDANRAARRVVTQIEVYTPLQEKDKLIILKTVDGVLRNGWRAGLVGFLALTWSSLRFFQALVIGRKPCLGSIRLPLVALAIEKPVDGDNPGRRAVPEYSVAPPFQGNPKIHKLGFENDRRGY
jgi:hypothetical protein